MASSGTVTVGVTPVVKPGPQTTEFWTTILTHAVAIVVIGATLLFHRTFADLGTLRALIPTGAAVASGVSQIAYSLSRAKVKVAAHQSLGSVVNQVSTIDVGLSANVEQMLSTLTRMGQTLETVLHPAATLATAAAASAAGSPSTPPANPSTTAP